MKRRMPYRLAVGAALAGSAALAVVVPSGLAGAGAPKPVKEVCTSEAGNATSQTLSGCTGSAVDGTSAVSVTTGANTATLTFNGTGLTALESYTYVLKTGKADKCPTPAGDTPVAEVKEKGTILSGGTATDLVGGKIKGVSCAVNTPGGLAVFNFPGKSADL